MTVLQNTWRQLVRRRLWPVAVLLVAALAAVPVLLKRDAESVALPPEPVPAGSVKVDESLGEPVVAMASAEDRDRRRRVLGARKDPFEPAPAPKAKEPEEAKPAPGPTGGSEPAKTPDAGVGGSAVPTLPPIGGAPIGGSPVSPAPVEEPAPKKKTYPANSLVVRFGDATGTDRPRGVLERLEALPEEDALAASESQPLLVYLGLDEDRTSAIFMVDQTVEATGDGSCHPHPSNCETIHLREGEIEFFDVKDETGAVVAQYQLDLIAINAKKKTSAKQARRALARAAKTGRRTLGVAAQVSAGL